jgi:hypothetical protein
MRPTEAAKVSTEMKQAGAHRQAPDEGQNDCAGQDDKVMSEGRYTCKTRRASVVG